MNRIIFAGLALATTAIAAPSVAATYITGGPAQNVSSLSRSADGVNISFTAGQFTGLPTALTNIAQITQNLLVSVSAPGIGINGGASSPQIDTNNANHREAMIVSASKAVSLAGMKLSYIDANDTLQVYGVNTDGSLTSLGFGGTIKNGLGGAATAVNTSANSGTTVLDLLADTGFYNAFVFTTRAAGDVKYNNELGQGYRIDSLTLNGAVPEPATWAMLIAGFGLVGASARRRRATTVTA